jgi:alanine dehydrogenase
MERGESDSGRTLTLKSTGPVPTAEFLTGFDIVVNCVLQDPTSPLMFVTDDDLAGFDPGTLFVDVSCDEGMGFEFARPTTFAEPIFSVGDGLSYYGVDHSPAYLWDAATWEISEALIPYLGVVVGGPEAWERSETIRRAVEIGDGVVRNETILSFQGRAAEFPHPRLP